MCFEGIDMYYSLLLKVNRGQVPDVFQTSDVPVNNVISKMFTSHQLHKQ